MAKRKKHEGTIWKHGNRFLACYYWKGKQHRDSYLTEEEAIARLMEVTRDKQKKRKPRSQNITIDKLLEGYLNNLRKRKKRSVADAKSRIDRFLKPYFEGMKIYDCTGQDIDDYVAERQMADPRPSDSSINRELSILRSSFYVAVKNNVISLSDMPSFRGRLLDEPAPIRRTFKAGTFETFREYFPDDCLGAIDLQHECGWRLPSEILTLQWSINIDFEEGCVKLPPNSTKDNSDKWREFYFTNRMREILTEQRQRIDFLQRKLHRVIPYVFCADTGKQLFEEYQDKEGILHVKPSHYLRTQWENACEKAKIFNTSHDLRRTAAVERDNAGLSRKDNMLMGGWATSVMLDRYLQKDKEDLKNAAKRIDQYRKSKIITESSQNAVSADGSKKVNS